MNELICRLALQFQPHFGIITIKKLIQQFGTATAIFEAHPSRTPLGKKMALPKLTATSLRAAENEANWMSKNNISLCFYTDPDYPKRLKNCVDAPYLFYYKGKNIFNHEKVVSIVGTRNISSYGKDITKKIVEELTPYNTCIVSGLACGVDSIAHEQALENDLPTVAVLGCGLKTIYPYINDRLAQHIIDKGGALLTEFPFQTKPDRQNFPQRNRIIAGLADATIVMETAKRGGSIITAYLAHSYNRDVFATPGSVFTPQHEGCHELIRKNLAALITSGHDIAEMMGWSQQKPKTIQRNLFVELSDDEQLVCDTIKTSPNITIDDLTLAFPQYSPSKLAALLLQLELKGMILCNPGKQYRLYD